MVCLKYAGLKGSVHQHTRAEKRYGVLRPLKPRRNSLAAAFRFVKVDKPPPGFSDGVMRRLE